MVVSEHRHISTVLAHLLPSWGGLAGTVLAHLPSWGGLDRAPNHDESGRLDCALGEEQQPIFQTREAIADSFIAGDQEGHLTHEYTAEEQVRIPPLPSPPLPFPPLANGYACNYVVRDAMIP